jgi:hypothetical protein
LLSIFSIILDDNTRKPLVDFSPGALHTLADYNTFLTPFKKPDA